MISTSAMSVSILWTVHTYAISGITALILNNLHWWCADAKLLQQSDEGKPRISQLIKSIFISIGGRGRLEQQRKHSSTNMILMNMNKMTERTIHITKSISKNVFQSANLVVKIIAIVSIIIGFRYGYKWRSEVKRRIHQISSNSKLLAMQRNRNITQSYCLTSNGPGVGFDDAPERRYRDGRGITMAREVALRPEFVTYIQKQGIELMSLGEYLSSLEPVGRSNLRPQEELDILVGAALLRLLGPRLGPALLPALGVIPKSAVSAGMGMMAAASLDAVGNNDLTNKETKKFFDGNDGNNNNDEDEGIPKSSVTGQVVKAAPSQMLHAIGGISLLQISGIADLIGEIAMRKREGTDMPSAGRFGPPNKAEVQAKGVHTSSEQKTDKVPPKPQTTAIDIMRWGEVRADTFPSEIIPNQFIISAHWDIAIQGMENKLGIMEPSEYPIASAKPVRDAMLPDLCIGFGGIRSTHTNRGILENRLLSILLNRLSANYLLDEITHIDPHGSKVSSSRDITPFAIKLDPNGKSITRPCNFIKALMDAGYIIKVFRAIRNTTFGMGLCVRESCDDAFFDKNKSSSSSSSKYFHIPLAVTLRTGLQDLDGNSISAFLTHSSLDLAVSGPQVNGLVQFYQSQEGFTGWNAGHYPNAPWAVDGITRDLDARKAVGLAGLTGAILNSVATKFALPMGGYGLTGVCNDSVAMIEQAIRGTTDIYPLLAIGGYYEHVIRRAIKMLSVFEHDRTISPSIVANLRLLLLAMKSLPNDVHPTHSLANEIKRRILASTPEAPPFEIMYEAKEMLEALQFD